MNQKKSISILSAIVLIVIGVICFGFIVFLGRNNDKYIEEAKEDDISRYEWMKMLCEQSGMTEYQNRESYYEDVSADNVYFPFIQSAAEWGVIEADKEFAGDGYASGRFVALTAMKAIGERKLEIYFDTEDVISDDTYLELAIEHDLIEKEKFSKGVSSEECDRILERLQDLYFGEFWRDDYFYVVYQDDVVELSPDEVLRSNINCSEIVVSDNIRDILEIGKIIVFEEKDTKLKLARKVTKIDPDGTLSLIPVELEHIVKSFKVSDITELTFREIVNAYTQEKDLHTFNHLNYQAIDARFIDTEFFSGEMHSKGFKITLFTQEDGDDKYLGIKITDNATGDFILLPMGNNIKLGGDYSAELDINKILIGAQAVLEGGFQYAEVAVDVNSTFKGEIKAEEETKLLLFKTSAPIPLAGGVAAVDIQFFLVLSIEGTVSIEAELPMGASVLYEKDKGFRHQKHELQSDNPKIEANCDAGVMVRFEPMLSVLGFKAMDVEADTGMTASAQIIMQPNSQICAETAIAFPVITLSVCGDDDQDTIIGHIINGMGWTAEWELITSDSAPVHLNTHFELLPDKTAQFVEECTYKENKEEVDDKTVTEEDVQAGDTYYTRYKEMTGMDRPEFCFDYPDDWTITREEVRVEHSDDPFMPDYMEYYDEIVELTNDRGVRITYTQYNMDPGSVGSGSAFYYTVEYEVEKVRDSSLELKHIPNSGGLMVAQIKELGGTDPEGSNYDSDSISYALMLNDKEGTQTTNLPGYYGMCSFYYPNWDSFQAELPDGEFYVINPYTFMAYSPDGQFTEREEKEVIEILSSFREVP